MSIVREGNKKTCCDCGAMKDLSEYYGDRSRSDGRKARCKECSRARKREWYEQAQSEGRAFMGQLAPGVKKRCNRVRNKSWSRIRLLEFSQRYKARVGCCQACGYDKYSKILQYHHKDPDQKKFGICDGYKHGLSLLKEEIRKCIILCPTCHAEVHVGGWGSSNLNNHYE